MLAAFLAIAIWNWRLAYSRGWAQLLPAFTRYLVFTAVSSIVLYASYWSTFSLEISSVACQVYLYTYYLSWFVATVLFLFFLYELLRITLPAHPEVRRGITAILASCVVGLSLAGNLMCLGCAAWNLRGLEPFGSMALRLQEFALIALFIRLLFIKGKFKVHWGRTMSLLVLGPVLAFATQPVLDYLNFRYGKTTLVVTIAGEIVSLIWMVLWWVALRTNPEPTSGAAAAPA